ncbi:pyrimidine 5'-nucleotidase [Shewanella intestini]|uniref:Pyrimidine 5'-nucleotidase n=1 Tax=Shewanella intestini TaxID=2017544 RepID=A0ABS5I265_9GAMM|nr:MULTISPECIES: pyrimidine 5'-nucleotidase [Shewanella]MBR9728115.1 pyrimidine 5'-nucleotidase [Shewanella intestini]MRG36586.1 pyrimidine 5'-nucleotidase [Shewanella sp. XMDDZSB0408]
MRIEQFKWLLFDADETLFRFDAFAGLQRMFTSYNVQFTEADFQQYQLLNKPLWAKYQDGEVDAVTLQHQRFTVWADKLACTTQELNEGFLSAMADICQPLPGAVELLDAVSPYVSMGIITNGFTQLQQTRLNKTGLNKYFKHVVVSEEVGVAKPNIAIFEYARELLGNASPQEIMMIGDNLVSDIQGGINAGMKTCWLNHQNAVNGNINPTFQVNHLAQLQQWLFSPRK